MTKTTISAALLIAGFIFFRLHYTEMIIKLLGYFFEEDIFSGIITERLSPNNYIGNFFPALFYFSVIIILIARTIDVILNEKAALKVLSSFAGPLVLTVLITICLCIPQLSILQLWAIFYLFLLMCLHSTLKMLILDTESVGSYANLKMIKGFFITTKNTIKTAFSTGIKNFRKPLDEVISLSVSGIIWILEIITLISFIVYIKIHWRLIFLSFLLLFQS